MEGLNVTDRTGFDTPDEIVAKQIIARFVETGLLPPRYADQARVQLATGKMRVEDWRLLAEKALELEKRQEDDQ